MRSPSKRTASASSGPISSWIHRSDGASLVWLGRAADGSPSRFVLDFQVPELATAEPG
ncbi:hypothetical protein [Lentzea atacamensis]|uniref:hypothetical protein n=1 Tax=Lentzea atacamensis TaxID=531938 RepID=UPI001475FEA0|nr:hypothetical protein [Lentzea atacamensis]